MRRLTLLKTFMHDARRVDVEFVRSNKQLICQSVLTDTKVIYKKQSDVIECFINMIRR